MCSFISKSLMFVLLSIRPSSSQTGLSEDGLLSAWPVYRLIVEVWYNTSTVEPVSKPCGEYYATTFLENFILTESFLQTSCEGQSTARLMVRHAVVARVRLFGSMIELITHINISLVEPDQQLHSNNGGPGIPPPVVSQSRTGKNDILRCANTINHTLLDPVSLQQNYNSHVQPADDDRRIDILKIEGSQCTRAVMEPRQFKISEAKWICPTETDYVYDDWAWQCVPRGLKTTTTTSPVLDIVSSTSTTTDPFRTLPDVITQEAVIFETIPPTSTPEPKPWQIRRKNNTGSIKVAEGDEPVPVTFIFSVNRTQLCMHHTSCYIRVQVNFTHSGHNDPKCRTTGDLIPQLVLAEPISGSTMDHCSLPLTLSMGELQMYEFTRTVYVAPMLDMKYDGTQISNVLFSVYSIVGNNTGPSEENALNVEVYIEDRDRKATCKSVNDPHITTFDGFEYNNFYEGEFVLYQHTTLPYKVHVIYQKCGPGIKASCNCAIAVQSGDDVIVIDRCRRSKQPFNRLSGKARTFTKMTVDIYLNGEITPGTEIFEEADGKKYVIYLPHGAYIKVIVSGELINVWIVASPKDARKTVGLCGNNNKNKLDDLQMRNGSIIVPQVPTPGERPQPREVCLDWRVELFGVNSIFHGVSKMAALQPPLQYCDCRPNKHFCGYAVDIAKCDVLQGKDVTEQLTDRAKRPVLATPRVKRGIHDNSIELNPDEPIIIDTSFTPPKHTWDKSNWQFTSAQDFCNNYVRDKYKVGQLCTQIRAVDFNQEITTCIEDIQITGNTSWADSARDAMKEQCLEEVQRNGSLSSDIANAIQNAICFNDCSGHGQCHNGSCVCDANWYTADCSLTMGQPPYSSELLTNGLCDTRFMRCNRVIVYGEYFIDNVNLTCHLQQTQIAEDPYHFKALPQITKRKGLFINFNAVECPLPEIKPYLVSVSNDGVLDHASDSLLFLPFDSACYTCSTNSTSCTKRINSCRIDGKCYLENERSPNDLCLICKPFADELQWTTDSGSSCRPSWWEDVRVPNWGIAAAAALGGSIVGVLIGFLLYKCCCKRGGKQKEESSDNDQDSGQEESDPLPCEDHILHRNRGMPSLMDDRYMDNAFRSPEVEETYFHTNSRRIQNGIDSTTYF